MYGQKKIVSPLGYIPPLDSIRALAIVSVVLSHANFRFALNGGIGVYIFFTLSGFLITTLLLEEFEKCGTISFKAFYIRRSFRLFPALYLMLAAVFAIGVFFCSDINRINIFRDIVGAALYIYNIMWAWGWGSENFYLYHTWSLSVEEQFYLLWPLILFLFLKYRAIKILLPALTVFIILVWFIKSIGFFPPLAGSIIKESIYIGCFGAIFRYSYNLSFLKKNFVPIICLIMLCIIAFIPYEIKLNTLLLNFISLISLVVVLHLSLIKSGILFSFLNNKTFIFIGKISYSLYLWHLPIFRFFFFNSTFHPWVSFSLKFLITFILSVLSWYFIEKPAVRVGHKLSASILRK